MYVQLINGTIPPKFQASHHCTAAEKAGLKPPLENQSSSISGKGASCGIQCNAGKINPYLLIMTLDFDMCRVNFDSQMASSVVRIDN